MDYLIALTLSETHEPKRHRVVNAALMQLAADGDPEQLLEEVGIRKQKSDAPVEVFRLLKVRVEGPANVDKAAGYAANAIQAGNRMLRSIGVPSNVQISVFVQPPHAEASESAANK